MACLLTLVFIISCENDKEESPSLKSLAVTDIGVSSVQLVGDITDIGTSSITECGISFDPNAHFVGGSNIVANSSFNKIGEFSITVERLAAGTEFTYRAFASNSEGQSYGERLSFTTLASSGSHLGE